MKFCFRLKYKPYRLFEQIIREINILFELSNHNKCLSNLINRKERNTSIFSKQE